MKELFFKCTLTSDVVLNSTLATEGNLASLDYIPGSNFLGIVAGRLYDSVDTVKAFDLFHSGKVKFGDACIYEEGISYPIPFSFFNGKNAATREANFYLHHKIVGKSPKDDKGNIIQLKQERQGYILLGGSIRKNIKKTFSLKSAQDRNTRSSKDGQMFGFESISKGQTFLFPVQFEDESLIDKVKDALVGERRIGKSKSAEFGQVTITEMLHIKEVSSFDSKGNYTLVYAQSNLCLEDENGSQTFQPTAKDLGIVNGEIIWSKSQIRTYSYSPWNSIRNTSNTERHCIAKGSVFYVQGKPDKMKNTLGLFQSEGLGRVIYNPEFLKEGFEDKTELTFSFKVENSLEMNGKISGEIKTTLGRFLQRKVDKKNLDNEISLKIHELIYSKVNPLEGLKRISSSQWGGIRSYASKAEDMDKLHQNLFDKDKGYLTHGVADIKFWGANKGANLKAFRKIFDENKDLGIPFIEKFAAEMAKEN